LSSILFNTFDSVYARKDILKTKTIFWVVVFYDANLQ
jgi:hypothetical protein